MKIGIITQDNAMLIRYAENFMKVLLAAEVFINLCTEHEILIERHHMAKNLANKFSAMDLLIWYNPQDTCEALAQKCLELGKLEPDNLFFYISSCQFGHDHLLYDCKNVKRFGIENHKYLAEKLGNEFLNRTVSSTVFKMCSLN